MSKTMGYKKIGKRDGINIYEAVIEVGYDVFGKRIRKRQRFIGDNESAKYWYAELIKKYYHKGKKVTITNMTFEDYSKIFIEKYCNCNIEKITTLGYKQYLKAILPLIGNIKLNKITSYMLDSMYQKIKKGKRNKELSSKTMLHYYNLMSLMFKQAKKWKFIETNPNEDTNKPKLIKTTRKFYDEEQVKELFKCLEKEDIKIRTIISLALVSGIRRSELCAIRWPDIDFDNKTLYIDNSLKIIDGKVDEENAKTQYSIRTIDLNEKMINLLKQYKDWQDNFILKLGSHWEGTNRVFTAKDGHHMHPSTPNKFLQDIIKKYNLPKITFHELRHTCASIMNLNGIDAKTISERLGHADATITLNTYTHSTNLAKKESAKVFEKY